MKEYYTYAYLREDGTPYYIGKGKGNRINDYHSKFVKVPTKERRLLLKQNLTEEESFRHEVYMINIFGRKDLGTGILINRSDGGCGGLNVRSRTFNQQQKDEIRTRMMGNKHKAYEWEIIYNDGRTQIVNGLRGWAEKNNYDPSCLIKVSKGKRNYNKDILSVKLIPLIRSTNPKTLATSGD